MVVGATGVRVADEVDATDGASLRYRADDVHDFAWTAWAEFRERDEDDERRARSRVLYPPGNDGNADATLAAVRHGLSLLRRALRTLPVPRR